MPDPLCGPVYRGTVENLVNGDRVLPRLLADIDAAERCVHLSMFLFFNDPIGQEVADHLAAASRRGVVVRVLINVAKTHWADPLHTGEAKMIAADPNFNGDCLDVNALAARLRAGGVLFTDDDIDYNVKPPHIPDAWLVDEEAVRKAVILSAAHIDHRKLVAIDGRVGYCGSANVGAQYLYHRPFDPRVLDGEEAKQRIAAGLDEPWRKWHDGLVRFEGEVVRAFDQVFRERWVLDGGDDFFPVTNLPAPMTGFPVDSLQIVTCQPSPAANAIRELFLRRIALAQSSIFIENPYMYHPAIIDALIAAKRARPGLRIDLVQTTRALNDSPFSADAQEFRYQRYLPEGIAVYEYLNHFNHLKIAAFDGRWSIFGSANVNYRSLEDDKDFEMCVLVDDVTIAEAVEREVRDVDVANSRRVDHAVLGLRSDNREPITVLLEELREI